MGGLLPSHLHATWHHSPCPPTSWKNPTIKPNANQLDTTVKPECCNWVDTGCSTETATIRRTIPTSLGHQHRTGQRIYPSLWALGAMSHLKQQQQQRLQLAPSSLSRRARRCGQKRVFDQVSLRAPCTVPKSEDELCRYTRETKDRVVLPQMDWGTTILPTPNMKRSANL